MSYECSEYNMHPHLNIRNSFTSIRRRKSNLKSQSINGPIYQISFLSLFLFSFIVLPFTLNVGLFLLIMQGGAVVRWRSRQGHIASAFHIWDPSELKQSVKCKRSSGRNSWAFSGWSGFLPQGKLVEWVRINTVKSQVISNVISQLL
jgi:hypothetical protein